LRANPSINHETFFSVIVVDIRQYLSLDDVTKTCLGVQSYFHPGGTKVNINQSQHEAPELDYGKTLPFECFELS
jgi:hypothetical protein